MVFAQSRNVQLACLDAAGFSHKFLRNRETLRASTPHERADEFDPEKDNNVDEDMSTKTLKLIYQEHCQKTTIRTATTQTTAATAVTCQPHIVNNNARQTHGERIANAWQTHGKRTAHANAWRTHVKRMANAGRPHGQCMAISKRMAIAWLQHGNCTATALQRHGNCIATAWQLHWQTHGDCMANA